jgi:hypothetical protein
MDVIQYNLSATLGIFEKLLVQRGEEGWKSRGRGGKGKNFDAKFGR